jgi:hypothetical protein
MCPALNRNRFLRYIREARFPSRQRPAALALHSWRAAIPITVSQRRRSGKRSGMLCGIPPLERQLPKCLRACQSRTWPCRLMVHYWHSVVVMSWKFIQSGGNSRECRTSVSNRYSYVIGDPMNVFDLFGLRSTWSDFFAPHWVIGGIIASLAWFFAGQQSFSNKNLDMAIAWQCVAVLLIVILCAWTVVKSEWLGFACGVVVLYLEIRSIRRILAIQDQQT